MRVRLIGNLIGHVGGHINPTIGTVLDLPEGQARVHIALGNALPVVEDQEATVERAETRVTTPPERRGPGRPRKVPRNGG
ncbi:hypothetical protein [Streptomyces sp. NPDC050507]|uniref:hypothetical protein n=1 Tax=Streptomyces sp. NPDC050507 TaxID=3365619 RepID=UPI0037933954